MRFVNSGNAATFQPAFRVFELKYGFSGCFIYIAHLRNVCGASNARRSVNVKWHTPRFFVKFITFNARQRSKGTFGLFSDDRTVISAGGYALAS